MNLKFKEYICLIIPPLVCIIAYCTILHIMCAAFNLSDIAKIVIGTVSTVLLPYPGLKLMYKYFNWYADKYMED